VEIAPAQPALEPYHGFNGLDREVVEIITGWFKANTPSR
jgi:hypothetical protein